MRLAKIYPNKCNRCSSPARNCDKFILCSNNKCKSRGTFKKFIARYPQPPKIVPGQTMDNPIEVNCPKCGTATYNFQCGNSFGSNKGNSTCDSCNMQFNYTFQPNTFYVFKFSKHKVIRLSSTMNWDYYL